MVLRALPTECHLVSLPVETFDQYDFAFALASTMAHISLEWLGVRALWWLMLQDV